MSAVWKVAIIFAPIVLSAIAATSAPALEKAVLDDMPVKRATAASAYMQDCAGHDDKGRTLCHACFTHMSVMPDGKIDVWSDNNEYTLENGKVLIEDPKAGTHSTHVAAVDGAKARAAGQAAFENYLTSVFEDGDKWCAGFGGIRHALKDVIADAARGHYVVTQ
ncbi:MAG: hypothetical protein JOZ72_14545 [Alphaproteobacteria bacterium]|nr:hypothetical protein [Alphaproteobacteria bacterium]